MTRIENILVSVDARLNKELSTFALTAESEAAVTEAFGLALKWGATLTFCHAYESSASNQAVINGASARAKNGVSDEVNSCLSALVTRADNSGITASLMTQKDELSDGSLLISQTGQYDLIIVGDPSKDHSSRPSLEATVPELLQSSLCPVWIVKPAKPREVREVAIVTDLSPEGIGALQLAVTVARAIHARLYLIHAIQITDCREFVLTRFADEIQDGIDHQLIDSIKSRMQTQLHRTDFRTLPFGVKLEIVNGPPETAIPHYVNTGNIDLLIIGTTSDVANGSGPDYAMLASIQKEVSGSFMVVKRFRPSTET